MCIRDRHYSSRHFNFIKESIRDINKELKNYKTVVCLAKGDIIKILASISRKFKIKTIHAHQETGVMATYKRDQQVVAWCRKNRIAFKEYLQQGVFRGIKNRNNWLKKWDQLMNQKIEKISYLRHHELLEDLAENNFNMIFKNKLVKKINLKIEKLDILKKTKSVGIEVSKSKV